MPDTPPPDNDPAWGRYLGLGLQMFVGVGLGIVVGTWLGRKFGNESRGVLIGVLVGVAGGMYVLIKDAVAMNRDGK